MYNLPLKAFEAVCDTYDESLGFDPSKLPADITCEQLSAYGTSMHILYMGSCFEVYRIQGGFSSILTLSAAQLEAEFIK